MQTSTPIIDLHIHSSLKPYGHSFYSNSNKRSFTDPSCIWFYDYRSRLDMVIESVLGICRYRQSDFTSLTDGQIKIACVSIYPIEKEFFQIRKNNLKPLEILIAEFASMLGKNRIRNIRNHDYSYFKDLCSEYEYLCSLNETKTNSRTYKLIKSADELSNGANLLIIPSIEGCHAFCDGNNPKNPENWLNIENNVKTVKEWTAPPLFVTFAHHFYNGLCTHAKSLFENAGKLLDQEFGMREFNLKTDDGLPTISQTGKKIINLLLSKNNGRRILIDVKHMSLEARKEYYYILQSEYVNEDIPVIWSHGATNLADNNEINMVLETDVYMIYKTSGIIGIEIDQRILGYKKNRLWKKLKYQILRHDKAYDDAYYFWKQVISIAEYAYKQGYKDNPWKCIALGSDYDGIINPLDSYPGAPSLNVLYQYLIIHLNEYWKNNAPIIPRQQDGPDAADIIYNIMFKNAFNFINKHYNNESLT